MFFKKTLLHGKSVDTEIWLVKKKEKKRLMSRNDSCVSECVLI